MLGGPDSAYEVELPAPGERPRGILETYTKAHSAEYQAQALIDLAIELGGEVKDFSAIREVVLETSHHTHYVIGTGANDPQKLDPKASRETLDHSIMYILAVALEDRSWHHEASYAPERAGRPSTVALWHKIRTVEDPVWTARYHESDPAKRAFGGRISIRMNDGSIIAGERAAADAHPNGRHPWTWPDYLAKFDALVAGHLAEAEARRFVRLVQRLPELTAPELADLTPVMPDGSVTPSAPTGAGIFDYPTPTVQGEIASG
jgi:2-methylcitrate dehydratase